MSILNRFIDSAHQVHADCKGHTDGALILGKRVVLSKLAGQKINTKSSSGTELVGVADLLPTVLWTKYFIEALGNNIEHNIIHQDNESTLRMLINDKKRCTPRTNHIKVFFFWQRTTTTTKKLSLQNATQKNVG